MQPPTRPALSLKDFFEKHLPYYISVGMTPDQYWHGDPTLTKAYREADKIQVERENYFAWLQGLYNYEAFLCASPVLRAFVKRNTRPQPYMEAPHPITKQGAKEQERDKEKAVFDKGMAKMQAWAMDMQKKFVNKKSENK